MAIENGTFLPGSKLPAQRKLEEMLNVSRSAIREAIKTLEGMGLLYSKRGSGTYVVDQLPLEFSDEHKEENTYTLVDIRTLSTEILDYSTRILAERTDKKDIGIPQEKNQHMIDHFGSLTRHEKFLYESLFGTSLVRHAGNILAYDMFIKLLKPVGYIDNRLVTCEKDYMNILAIDAKLIESILNSEANRACFWGLEREVERIIGLTEEDYKRTYEIF